MKKFIEQLYLNAVNKRLHELKNHLVRCEIKRDNAIKELNIEQTAYYSIRCCELKIIIETMEHESCNFHIPE